MDETTKALLRRSDLQIDATYQGGREGNSADDPLGPLVGVSNQGGFRILGTKEKPSLIVISSNLKDPDWPDGIDKENGIYTYFGDNKKPGRELHDTPRYGNLLLAKIFNETHHGLSGRKNVPPVLVFTNSGKFRDVVFIGLAVPGAQNLTSNEDLVAVWKFRDGKRFQNYQAKFTILDASVIAKKWLADIVAGNPMSEVCPKNFRLWVETGKYTPLRAVRSLQHRTMEEQLPDDELGMRMISNIHDYFQGDPVRFEACAGKIAEMMIQNISSIDVTRPSRDGGRDAIGKFRIGESSSSVLVDFALEAKCYHMSNSVGVKELSRLISRLRHRQFGILVTTSFVAAQAYKEIKEDEHPILIIAAVDIVRILKKAGFATDQSLSNWLGAF